MEISLPYYAHFAPLLNLQSTTGEKQFWVEQIRDRWTCEGYAIPSYLEVLSEEMAKEDVFIPYVEEVWLFPFLSALGKAIPEFEVPLRANSPFTGLGYAGIKKKAEQEQRERVENWIACYRERSSIKLNLIDHRRPETTIHPKVSSLWLYWQYEFGCLCDGLGYSRAQSLRNLLGSIPKPQQEKFDIFSRLPTYYILYRITKKLEEDVEKGLYVPPYFLPNQDLERMVVKNAN